MNSSLFGSLIRKKNQIVSSITSLYYSGLNQSINWYSSNNWYCNSGLTISSNGSLPDCSTNTFICGRCSPIVNIDNNWINPKTIKTINSLDCSGIYLYSYKNNTFNGCIIGNSVFSGNIEVANSPQQSVATGPCNYTNPITNQIVSSCNINGPTTFGYFRSGIIYNNYTNYTPQLSIDGTNKYVIFENGKSTLASGAFSNGYFSGGLFLDHFSTTNALDSIDGKTYTVKSGQSIPVDGYYNSAYYGNGVRYPNVPNGHGESIYPSNDGKTYVNNNGQIELAHGPYSFGYFFYGYRLWTTIKTPVRVLDSNIYYYWYSNGIPVIANGYFTVGYFEEGIQRNMSHPTPLLPQDSLDKYYCYTTISSFGMADGYFSNGYFIEGILSTVNSFTTTVAIDCDYLNKLQKWFDYYVNGYYGLSGPGDREPLVLAGFYFGRVYNGNYYLHAIDSNSQQRDIYIKCGCEINPTPDYIVQAVHDESLVEHSSFQNGFETFVGSDPCWGGGCFDGTYNERPYYSAGQLYNGTISAIICYTWTASTPEGSYEFYLAQNACADFVNGVYSAYLTSEII